MEEHKGVEVIDFIKDSFTMERYERELRLSTSELALLKETYPKADVRTITNNDAGDKQWYTVKILGESGSIK